MKRAPSTVEVQASVIALGWTIWLLIGQPFASMPVFRVAQSHADEWVWALAFLVGAGAHVIGHNVGNRHARRAGLILIGIIWLLMAGCILATSPRAPGIWTLWVLAISAFYEAATL